MAGLFSMHSGAAASLAHGGGGPQGGAVRPAASCHHSVG